MTGWEVCLFVAAGTVSSVLLAAALATLAVRPPWGGYRAGQELPKPLRLPRGGSYIERR